METDLIRQGDGFIQHEFDSATTDQITLGELVRRCQTEILTFSSQLVKKDFIGIDVAIVRIEMVYADAGHDIGYQAIVFRVQYIGFNDDVPLMDIRGEAQVPKAEIPVIVNVGGG